ncbi:MAG: pyridoxamine 5'-phosphate oxidase family protein [Pseudomonadota bacterium]
MALDKEHAYRLIDSTASGRLAQLDAEGQVHAIPFVFVRQGDALYSPVDGKPKRHAKLSRLAWIKAAPAVTVLLDHYEDDWSRLWWLRIYGDATEIGDNDRQWDAITRLLGNKYPQYAQTPMFSGTPTMMRISISRWKHWAAA